MEPQNLVGSRKANGWTPGPWRIGEYREVLDANGKVVRVSGISMPCGHVPEDDDSYRNAELIAAAPEMYAALEKARDTLDACAKDTIGTPTCDLFRMQVDECNAVLAKARGEAK